MQVQLIVGRLAEFKTDLLVSITRPVAKPMAVAGKPIASGDETAADAALALSIIDSIKIQDNTLFGESSSAAQDSSAALAFAATL